MTRALDDSVRTRIAPAPSGDLHVGNVRTALFSWALARRHGGRFILRIEDTDASRVSDDNVEAAQEILRWVGLDWDEGPGIGGVHAPYRQSERGDVYAAALDRLVEAGPAYRCYCTAEEVTARTAVKGRAPGYDGHCRDLTWSQRQAYEAQGRTGILRFRMPPGATTWHDLVRGDITIAHDQIPDFALTRSDGGPLYVLAAAVDDAAMGLTHIVRGEDLIAATPRQMAIYDALDHPREKWPDFAHLPLITGDDGKPLSKRNGEVSLRWYREHGFLREALINYLALLGWSLAPDREIFGVDELVAAFALSDVGSNPARFDLKKLEAVNGEWIRGMNPAALTVALNPVLTAAGLEAPPGVIESALPLLQTRMVRLTDAVDYLSFLLVDEADFTITDHDQLVAEVLPTLVAAREGLAELVTFTASRIEVALREALVDGLGLKPRAAFGPVRVAVTGRRVSLPLWESLELLGRERTLHRLDGALAEVRGTTGDPGEEPFDD